MVECDLAKVETSVRFRSPALLNPSDSVFPSQSRCWTFLFLSFLTMAASGCASPRPYWIKSSFVGSLKRIGATRYDIKPGQVRSADGAVAVESEIRLKKRGKEKEIIHGFTYG